MIDSDLSIPQLIEVLLGKLKCVETSPKLTVEELHILEGKLDIATAALRRQRNTYCPVNKLPPETLSIIFSEVQTRVASLRPVVKGCLNGSWLPVTHVCQYWRQTALIFSSLWSSIDLRCSHDHALTAFLERSSLAPLKIYYAAWPPGSKGAKNELPMLHALQSHTHRFEEFHIVSQAELGEPVWESFRSPAPFIESLTISMPHTRNHNSALPPIFSDQLPRLKKLTLSFFTSWPGNGFKSLTHISFHNQSDLGRYTFAEFLAFIQQSPLLEELVLIKAGPQVDEIFPEPEKPRETIALSCLRSVEIGLWPSVHAISRFLSHLEVPNCAVLRIWGSSIFSTDVDLVSLFPRYSTRRNWLHGINKIRVTSTGLNVDQLIVVKGSTLDIYGDFRPNQYLAVTQICFMDEVEELWLSGSQLTHPTVVQYQELFRHLTSVKTIVIVGVKLNSILRALGLFNWEEKYSVVNCPHLHTIRVYDTPSTLSSHIALFVEKRARRGHPLQYLRLESYEEEDMEHIQKHVQDVKFGSDVEHDKKFLDDLWPTPASEWK